MWLVMINDYWLWIPKFLKSDTYLNGPRVDNVIIKSVAFIAYRQLDTDYY